jgi:hypothetical protein
MAWKCFSYANFKDQALFYLCFIPYRRVTINNLYDPRFLAEDEKLCAGSQIIHLGFINNFIS